MKFAACFGVEWFWEGCWVREFEGKRLRVGGLGCGRVKHFETKIRLLAEDSTLCSLCYVKLYVVINK